MIELKSGRRRGTVEVPLSKSHLHRLLIARFLAGERGDLEPVAGDGADIAATRRCLKALAGPEREVELDCGESGSTLRFLSPLAAALGKRSHFRKAGRLASRPALDYGDRLAGGVHALEGNVSSQFVTGLLMALPLVAEDSEIRFLSPLASRGYVELTLAVLAAAGIRVERTASGFRVPGNQRYQSVPLAAAERDWSSAAFWLTMNFLGSDVAVPGLNAASAQPDRAVVEILARLQGAGAVTVAVDECPDLFPVLAVAAAARAQITVFTGIRRLRLKESDRVSAMAEVLGRFGVAVQVSEERFEVRGSGLPFRGGGEFTAFGDHRIAMAVAVGATVAAGAVTLDAPECAGKSYPGFFAEFAALAEAAAR